ncbi:hypothetical protein [Basfia succiniciproducens]|uniref:Uncharacterized protein n=1 Tax=Basfia succiniciproducens TaxID=653940 RepID=A0A1G5E929_9PAST|nr:hypothetical protein [Basfia succiniciproducens]QIM69278.1 hypothetical protein A4G13_07665 [Basfia succiniciproducens]SCY23476.1 hypothetical protein SAMN02910354_01949 [Basfia succiniciproducens]
MYSKCQFGIALTTAIYLFLLLCIYLMGMLAISNIIHISDDSTWKGIITSLNEYSSVMNSIFIGGIGGSVYCLRAIYLNFSVFKKWDNDYLIWYLIRPILSLVIGGISYLFVKAGLVLFSSSEQYELNQLSLLSLSFLCGLNIDKFMKKLESIGEMVWGISPSNMGKTEGTKSE